MLIAALMALPLPATAAAHITLQPETAPADTFTRLDVRVPNERDNSGTVKVDVQMPDGFYFASYEPVPGWNVEVKTERLDEPVEIEAGFEATEQVTRITWTGEGPEGVIPPGAFQDFGLSVLTPDAEAEELTFKALQTYESGEVVRWIGPPDSEEPAPIVTLTGPSEAAGADTAHAETADDRETVAAEPEDDDDAPMGLAVAGVVLGGLGLLAGGASLVRRGRG
jgi:uncharacterized protein YcnI